MRRNAGKREAWTSRRLSVRSVSCGSHQGGVCLSVRCSPSASCGIEGWEGKGCRWRLDGTVHRPPDGSPGTSWFLQGTVGLRFRSCTCPASPGLPVGQYASPEAKRCCQDGLTRLPMVRTCEQRAARVRPASCQEPFLSCCLFAEVLRKNQTKSQAGFARGEQPGAAGDQ